MPPQQLTPQLNAQKIFDKILLEVVDQGIRNVLGEPAVRFIYDYIEKNFSLRRNDIPVELEVFAEGLDEMLGSGAKVIENYIVKNLCSHLGFNYQCKKDYRFSDYVRKIEVKFLRSRLKSRSINFEQEGLG